MPAFKPAYLIHGDDHGRVGERRARLRALAQAQGGTLEAAATPEAAASLLSALTLSIGRRFIIVDEVESWKDAAVKEHLAGPLASMPPDTTIAFFACEEARAKAPAALHALVKAAGGDLSAEMAVKEWDLPKWVVTRAAELELTLDLVAAKALVQAVGARQARLSREIEKLAIECGPGAKLDAGAVLDRVARSSERKAWTLADALVHRDSAAATRLYLELRAQGERVESLAYWMTRRLREALGVAAQLESGASPASIASGLRMPPKAAAAFIADVRRTDATTLRSAIAAFADLEVDSRGRSALDPDTLALRTICALSAEP
ncbi:MAG: DNA polymerase III subunit delta [Solirubrobacteraceae bacterium]|jgi:DNA polymerase-3 subunit delta